MSTTTSVIFRTKDCFNNFQVTIGLLSDQSCLPDELIVVDASRNEKIRAYLDSINIPFRHYFHTAPDLTYQRNYGIEKSNGDSLFFFDNDVDLYRDYISLVEQVFQKYICIRLAMSEDVFAIHIKLKD